MCGELTVLGKDPTLPRASNLGRSIEFVDPVGHHVEGEGTAGNGMKHQWLGGLL